MSLQSNRQISFSDINKNFQVTGGNMGIGTTSPAHTLDVNGGVRSTNFTTTNALVTNTSSGTLNLSTGLTTGSAQITNSNVTTETIGTARITTALLAIGNSNTVGSIFTTGGNVGISTESPSYKLHVVGDINYTGSLYQNGSLFSGGGGSSQWLNSGSNIYFSTGNVGINTTTPAAPLHVNGSGSGTSGSVLITGKDAYNNSLYVATDNASKRLGFNHNGTIGNIFSFDYSAMTSRNLILQWPGGNVGIATTNPATTLHVSGGTTIESGVLTVKNNGGYGMIELNGATGSYIDFGPDSIDYRTRITHSESDRSLNFYVNGGTNIMTLASTGNVGIGTGAPTAKLNVSGDTDIYGSLRVSANSSSTGFLINLGTSGVGSYRSAYLYGNGTNIDFLNQQNGYINFGTNNTFNRLVIGADGRVGIGIGSPANNGLQINSGELQLGPSTSSACHLYGVGGGLQVYTGSWGTGSILGYWNTTGLGIGTGTPAYKLHVYGGRIGIDDPNNAVLELKTNSNTSYIFTENTGSLKIYPGSTSHHVLLQPGGGNVGIGIDGNPACPLHVKGAGSGGTIRTYPSTYNSESSIGFYSGESSGSYWVAGKGSWSAGDGLGIGYSGYGGVMTLGTNGGVGIRTSPSYPLHVNGYIDGYYAFSYYGNIAVGTGSTGTDAYTVPVSIYATSRVAASQFNAFSDSRIKTNVQDVVDSSALETIRQIEPKRYKYIDTLKRTNETVWGFIAQQVGSVLENSTGKITDFVPNIFDKVSISDLDGDTLLTLQNRTSVEFDISDNATKRIRLHTQDDTEVFVTLKTVVSSNSFTVEETLSESSYFAYGQEVKDFHTLNKDAIFTVAVAALQEVDRQLQQERQKVSTLETEFSTLQQQYQDLLARIVNLESN